MTGPDTAAGALGAAALWYASHGVRVFPLRPGDKKPLPGFTDWPAKATTDPAQIAAWWSSTPAANVGAVMGDPFDVLDLDSADAIAAARQLLGGDWPPHLGTARTPKKNGLHVWLPASGRRRALGILPKVDWLGAGGYVVLPPSRIRWGDEPEHGITAGEGAYRWETPPTLDPAAADVVPWLALWAVRDAEKAQHAPTPTRGPLAPPRAAGASPWAARALAEQCATAAAATTGTRNDTLNVCAFRVGQLVPHLLAEADAVAALAEAARACGLPDAEAALTIRSGLTSGMKSPREPAPRPEAVSPLAGLLPPQVANDLPPAAERIDPATGEVLDEPPPAPDLERVATLEQFPRLDLAALLDPNRPPREWVLAGLIPAGASVSLVSPAGVGKSLLALSSSLAIARGHRAFADLGIPRRRRVLYVDMENTADDLAERFTALGVRPGDDLGDLVFLHLPALDALDTPRGGRQLEAIADAYGLARGDLVVLDSMQRVTTGAENDADTLRAFYVCTALPLKRRGLTVLRTDNTGKDADKGARGTSGKRDDVDVELILTRDAENPNRLRITPGKVRIPDVRQMLLSRDVDEDGRLTYSSAGDPFRALVLDAWRALDALDPDHKASQREAERLLRDAGHKYPRTAVRAALKERHACG